MTTGIITTQLPPPPPRLLRVLQAIADHGGRGLIVGGWVRDGLLGLPARDMDVEVFGLGLESLRPLLARFGTVVAVGRSFAVLKIKGLDADFSLPRASSLGSSVRGDLRSGADPGLDATSAARRRDLTINSMAFDPLQAALLDPLDGLSDLRAGRLRPADPTLFGEDPVRGLRVAELLARYGQRFDLKVDPELLRICMRLDLSDCAAERLYESFKKLLLRGDRPSLGLAFLRQSTLLRFFPELAALVEVPQSPYWHPEGCVWTHTLMVTDAAAGLRRGDEDDPALMFGALCHDLGKPETTVEHDGRIRSPRHEQAGIAPTTRFLAQLSAPGRLLKQVCALVEHHLKPVQFPAAHARAGAYRRLARQLAAAEVSIELLARVARADQLGRTTSNARQGLVPEVDAFLQQAAALEVTQSARPDVVQGRHLLARGIEPGPRMGELLARCRELQDEIGETRPEPIIDRLFDQLDPLPPTGSA
ncbi:MAG: CCA tRNA nucleotidyltransferase [Gammaproteobacteria bacterium]|nr:CCA tRNA nucleotidyltransferase [Gammaproteobacteria bacterium]